MAAGKTGKQAEAKLQEKASSGKGQAKPGKTDKNPPATSKTPASSSRPPVPEQATGPRDFEVLQGLPPGDARTSLSRRLVSLRRVLHTASRLALEADGAVRALSASLLGSSDQAAATDPYL